MPRNGSFKPKRVNLALQGGGAHGAFTWGVLDHILEDGRLEIDSITGASAGAMNAAVLAEGLAAGGRAEARERLRNFWCKVGDAARRSPIQRSFMQKWMGGWSLDTSPGYLFFDIVSRVASPYDLNPFDVNPLRDIVEEVIDFDAVCDCEETQVFISATNVETGQAKVFNQDELTADHIMASACLPLLYKAVWIDGAPYWDGGYMGNPPLWPLFDHADSDDVIIVQINPMTRPGAPRSAREILNRLNEITFNASLMRELRAIDFVSRLMDTGRLEGTGYRRVLTHIISGAEAMAPLGASSKLNAETEFLEMLFDHGCEAAKDWLDSHFDDLNNRPTVDLRALFGGDTDPLDGDRIGRQAHYQSKATTSS